MQPSPAPPDEELPEFRLPLGVAILVSLTIVFCLWYGYFWHHYQMKKKQEAEEREAREANNDGVDGNTAVYTGSIYLIDISDRARAGAAGSQNRRVAQTNTVIVDPSPPAYYISAEWSARRNNEDYLMDNRK